MWEVLAKMTELGITADTQTYSHIISRYTANENLEVALRYLYDGNSRGLAPQTRTTEDLIILAGRLGSPRLALDLAASFEASSVRKLDTSVWMHCLISSAQSLYVSHFTITPSQLSNLEPFIPTVRWCHAMLEYSCQENAHHPRRRHLPPSPPYCRS